MDTMMEDKGYLTGQARPEEAPKRRIGQEEIRRANEILHKYKAGKANLEKRVISDENWWKLRHWKEISGGTDAMKTTSAWLFNVIMGKHADAVEAYPEPNILPREEGDKAEAKILSSIIPCVMERNGFEQTYSDCAWKKMKSGTAIYGVFWDKNAVGGMGDIAIRPADPLNLFWKPGISYIEESPNLFAVDVVENRTLEEIYPELTGKLRGNSMTISKYIYDDSVDTSDTSLVVDWYYKRRQGGKTVLHYCKYVGETVLYASEDDPQCRDGFYTDGEYPYVFDALFPVEGSPCGYGYIDIGKSAQESIDKMNQAIVNNCLLAATPRFFVRQDGAVNEKEFADWTKPFVHVNGNLGDDTIKQIQINPLSGTYVTILNNKIEELKFTSGNQDVNNGGTASGVTAASAIAALQEAAGRSSKASTKSAYRAYARIVNKCIERIRQFYDMPRQFRITGQYGTEQFVSYSNSGLQPQYQGMDFGVDTGYRLPVFDIRVSAQKENPYTKMSQNELALQFYNLGFFNPQLTDQALATLEMMDFNGKDSVQQRIQQNGTMYQQLILYQQMALTLAAKYEPQMAEGLAQNIMGADMAAVPQARKEDDTKIKDEEKENAVVANARAKSQAATQPR